MQPRLFEISRHNHASLCITTRPSSEFLAEDLDHLRVRGVEIIISLLTNEEVAELALDNEEQICRDLGIKYVNHPILDRGIPSDDQSTINLVADIHAAWITGKTSAIHCRAGIGRSGMIAAAVLLRDGMQLDDAVRMVSQRRGVETPDTEEQILWISQNQKYLIG